MATMAFIRRFCSSAVSSVHDKMFFFTQPNSQIMKCFQEVGTELVELEVELQSGRQRHERRGRGS